MTIVQAILTDIAPNKKERTKYYSWMGIMFGLAFIVGPFLGSMLNAISFSAPFIITGIICLIATGLVVFALKETIIHQHDLPPVKYGFFPVFHALMHSKMAFYLWLGIIIQLGNNVARSAYSLYLDAFYHLNVQQIGYFFTVTGVFMALCQGLLLGKFWLKKFSPKLILQINLIASIIIFILIALYDQYVSVPNIFIRTFLECLMMIFTIAIWPVIQSEGIQHAQTNEKGESSGYFGSVFSLVGIVAPLAGSYVVQHMISPMWFA